jgi:hypothetical protein
MSRNITFLLSVIGLIGEYESLCLHVLATAGHYQKA